jgi:cytochrome c oxidase cbb3-type subunit 3
MVRVTVDRLYRVTKEGRAGTAMPAWGQVLSESQIGDVIDYIRSLGSPRAPTMSAAQISLEVGRRIYRKECEACHGPDGTGNIDVTKVLRPPPRNLADPIEMARVDDGRLYSAIKLGRPGTIMGGWGELLSPAEIIDVMRYARTLVRPLPVAMSAAKLDVAVGEKIYQQYCVSCHGERGDGQTLLGQSLIPRPGDFSKPREGSRTSDVETTRVIARGIPGTAMAPWSGILNSEDIRRVIAFIRQAFRPSP